MYPVRQIVLALSLLVAGGCSITTAPFSGAERRELVKARIRWEASPARNAYRYEVRQSCFCPEEFVRWNTITVVNGAIVDVRTTEGVPVPSARWESYLTVERLFSILDTGTDDRYLEDVVVRFDPVHGYPTEMTFTTSPEIADGGGATYARNLVPVQLPLQRPAP